MPIIFPLATKLLGTHHPDIFIQIKVIQQQQYSFDPILFVTAQDWKLLQLQWKICPPV